MYIHYEVINVTSLGELSLTLPPVPLDWDPMGSHSLVPFPQRAHRIYGSMTKCLMMSLVLVFSTRRYTLWGQGLCPCQSLLIRDSLRRTWHSGSSSNYFWINSISPPILIRTSLVGFCSPPTRNLGRTQRNKWKLKVSAKAEPRFLSKSLFAEGFILLVTRRANISHPGARITRSASSQQGLKCYTTLCLASILVSFLGC